jgi:hypothetical protein
LSTNILPHLQLLGTTMKDRVTGIKGMVDSISFDAYGCVQASLRPPANKDGTLTDGRWFDVKRLEPAGKRILPAPPFVAPGLEIGAADKPARPC